EARRPLAGVAVPALAERLGLRNEFEPGAGHPTHAAAFIRRVGATAGAIGDADLERADAIVHVASSAAATVAEFCAEATRLLAPVVKPRVLQGVVRPTDYTSAAMNQFAYAHAVPQQPGAVAPNAFLLPLSKTQAWRPSASPWLIAASVMLATFMEVLDTSVANVSLPHIAGSLAASNEEALWVLTSYLVSNAIVLPATGWFASVFGRKRFLMTCIVIFTLASILAGAATSLGMIIVARAIQ